MAMECIHGLMAESMKVTTCLIKSMERANISGMMEEFMMVSGLMENKMALANTYCQMVKPEKENGQMEREPDGLTSRLEKAIVIFSKGTNNNLTSNHNNSHNSHNRCQSSSYNCQSSSYNNSNRIQCNNLNNLLHK